MISLEFSYGVQESLVLLPYSVHGRSPYIEVNQGGIRSKLDNLSPLSIESSIVVFVGQAIVL